MAKTLDEVQPYRLRAGTKYLRVADGSVYEAHAVSGVQYEPCTNCGAMVDVHWFRDEPPFEMLCNHCMWVKRHE